MQLRWKHQGDNKVASGQGHANDVGEALVAVAAREGAERAGACPWHEELDNLKSNI